MRLGGSLAVWWYHHTLINAYSQTHWNRRVTCSEVTNTQLGNSLSASREQTGVKPHEIRAKNVQQHTQKRWRDHNLRWDWNYFRRRANTLSSSVQFKKGSGKPIICAPPRLSRVSPMLPLKYPILHLASKCTPTQSHFRHALGFLFEIYWYHPIWLKKKKKRHIGHTPGFLSETYWSPLIGKKHTHTHTKHTKATTSTASFSTHST